MSDSITPFGTTRSVFSLATNDLEINGDITASKFLGSGEKLTNIRINSINQSTYNNNEYLLRSLGGTGNRSFIDKGIYLIMTHILDLKVQVILDGMILRRYY